MSRTALTSLRNSDYTDRELLHLLNDQAGGDGWATTEDLADALGIASPNGKMSKDEREAHGKRCVGSRFSYMVRIGWIERDEDRKNWRLTSIGRDLMSGKLSKGVENSLGKLKPADRILVMRELTKGYRQDSQPAATMLRREWQHGATTR